MCHYILMDKVSQIKKIGLPVLSIRMSKYVCCETTQTELDSIFYEHVSPRKVAVADQF